jgi:hypothetical protein
MVRETSRVLDAASHCCGTPSRVPPRRVFALSADIALQAPPTPNPPPCSSLPHLQSQPDATRRDALLWPRAPCRILHEQRSMAAELL